MDRPFVVDIPEAAISDLRDRLFIARWPTSVDADRWDDGASLSFMTRLRDHWLNRFDWRAQERRINRLPNRMMTVDGQDVHFVHQPGTGSSPLPLVVTHGWPGSFVEMERIIPLLADPGAHGADPADAFHVVVPSLPGYGFSPAPASGYIGSRQVAVYWRQLMVDLGYHRFGAQGGDIGAGVSMWLARLYPNDLTGLHLNYVPGYRPAVGEESPPRTDDERSYLETRASWSLLEGAYAALHGTKPQTLAFALSDSPLGLAAWITEKVRTWSDCNGDIERVMSMDALLTNICLYWFGNSLTASLGLYKANRLNPLTFAPGERVKPPLGVAVFPRELPMPPRSWVERVFDVGRWTTMPVGGHFAALEQPERLADDIRAFFRPLRSDLRAGSRV